MGNCFSKDSGAFSGEGRTLGSTETTPLARPARNEAPKVAANSPGRTLGKSQAGGDTLSPKEAAARAAETRAAATTSSSGALGKKLNAQKQQSQSATLAQNARDNLRNRDADNGAQARQYN